MTTTSPLTAREVVDEIIHYYENLNEKEIAEMKALTPSLRSKLESMMLQKDQFLGDLAITLAKNLYTSSARFVFELLQNADDNDYSLARERGVEPYVLFQVLRDKVIMECNENGFTHENVKAICAVGKSSKADGQAYIGEKGIGFKSVFTAASRVHIQSNDFSFSFTHHKGDSGIGMVTPVWQEPEEVLGDCLTRITLFLHKSGDPSIDREQHNIITEQFEELQDTILLFLRNIRLMHISLPGNDDSPPLVTTYSVHGTHPTTVRKTVSSGGAQVEKRFYITKHMAQGLPKSENRSYPDDEPQSDSAAEVILAFPLTEGLVPSEEYQDVFAFLPMRPMGFKFLIQSDFVTQANRQDIVTTSPRNQRLREDIADCFVKAVEEFCQHQTLQFQWMRWLPQQDSYHWDSFWTGLLEMIKSRLGQAKVMRTLNQRRLEVIPSVRQILPTWLDKHGDPLFKDAADDRYLAKEYRPVDLGLLRQYGLLDARWSDLFRHIEKDLSMPTSRMKALTTDDDWHSRAAEQLIILHEKATEIPRFLHKFLSLEIIPLENGSWVSASKEDVFFAHCSDFLEIPTDLGIRLVDAEAAKNSARRKVFSLSGVKVASVQDIRRMILSQPVSSGKDQAVLSASVEHLKFLYLSHNSKDANEHLTELENCYIYDQNMEPCWPRSTDVYFATTERYGPSDLLQSAAEDSSSTFPVSFIHDEYLDDAPDLLIAVDGKNLTWLQWMEDCLSVRRHLRLAQKNDKDFLELSPAFNFILIHQPRRFIGALQRHWKHEDETIINSPAFIKYLRRIRVLCQDGEKYPLSETYLPLEELERKHDSYRYRGNDGFRFLDLDEPVIPNTGKNRWGFLVSKLGVGDRDNMIFYLRVLESIRNNSPDAGSLSTRRTSVFAELYQMIEIRCHGLANQLEMQSLVRFVDEMELIFVPGIEREPACWTSSIKCLWEAPPGMQTMYPLKHLYESRFAPPEKELGILRQFFQTTLQIPNCAWNNALAEIEHLRDTGNTNFDRISSLYGSLSTFSKDLIGIDGDKLKKAFSDSSLIYATTNEASDWCTVGQCLWSSATQIRGKVAINSYYPNLESFFVQFLGVPQLNLQMACEELKRMGTGKPSPTVETVKETIWAVNSLLQSVEWLPNNKDILASRIFPVRYPNHQVTLHTAATEFAIVDRKILGDAFDSEAKFLDFTMDEVRRLGTFLTWLGLGIRYLSIMVKEVSTVTDTQMTRLIKPDRDIRHKAHGLFRIAAHWNSPRISGEDLSLYHILKNAEVYETDEISSVLHLSQDGRGLQYVKEKSDLYMREANGVLKLFVPLDPKSQGFCYFSRLPRRFLEWMMTEPLTLLTTEAGPQALHVVTTVLNAPRINVSQILEAEGIIERYVPEGLDNYSDVADMANSDSVSSVQDDSVSSVMRVTTPTKPVQPTRTARTGSSSKKTRVSRVSGIAPNRSTPASSTRAGSPVLRTEANDTAPRAMSDSAMITRRANARPQLRPAPVVDMASDDIPTRPTPSPPVPLHGEADLGKGISVSDAEYTKLLETVIIGARAAIFPSRGAFDMSGLSGTLPVVDGEDDEAQGPARRFRSKTPLERDMRIGAAGELFVFELLLRLHPSLPRFSRDNWQSLVRKYVTAYPEYADMAPWVGRETADIVYHDQSRVLTELLVDKGYMKQTTWLGKTPKYLIEVKATTGHAHTPFYMSRRQYQRMQEHSNVSQSPLASPTVYIIVRVFNVGKQDIDLKVYVDPDIMRQEGLLVFTEDTWSVIPARVLP